MRKWVNKVNFSSFQLKNFFKFVLAWLACAKQKIMMSTVFACSDANMLLSQSECMYYLMAVLLVIWYYKTGATLFNRIIGWFSNRMGTSVHDGKACGKDYHDFQCEICHSAFGQASCLICTHCRQLMFRFYWETSVMPELSDLLDFRMQRNSSLQLTFGQLACSSPKL